MACVQEELDLGFLAQRGASISAGDAKAPVAIVVKTPCLAIRYPSIANQVFTRAIFDVDFTVLTLLDTSIPSEICLCSRL